MSWIDAYESEVLEAALARLRADGLLPQDPGLGIDVPQNGGTVLSPAPAPPSSGEDCKGSSHPFRPDMAEGCRGFPNPFAASKTGNGGRPRPRCG